MQMPVRIKARDDFTARFALSLVGGKYRDGAYPKFEFVSQEQRRNYELKLRELEGKKNDHSSNCSHSNA